MTASTGAAANNQYNLADFVFVGPNVVFTNDRYPRSARLARAAQERPTEADWLVETWVETGASIGANATILPGLRLGEYCMIGAGSVVTRAVAPHELVAGNPARVIGRVDDIGRVIERLPL